MKRLLVFLLMGYGASEGHDPGNASGPPVNASTENRAPALQAAPSTETAAEPIERRLFPQTFSASSHLENDWNTFQENYLAEYLGDDDPTTSWTEGKSDVGLGESVTVEHTALKDATSLRLEIRNGYQKSRRLFRRNARAKEISLTLLPSKTTSKHTLADSEGWQTVTVEQPIGPLDGYEIQFDSVYAGSHYEDLVISDIQTYVTATTPDNPSFETSKQEKLLGWIEARRDAAKTFKEAAKGSIPVAATYKVASSAEKTRSEECYGSEECALPFAKAVAAWGDEDSALAALERAAREQFKGWKPLRISTVDTRRIPQADQFVVPGPWVADSLVYQGDQPAITLPTPGLIGYFSANNLKRVFGGSADVSASSVIRGKAPGCKKKGENSHYFFTPSTEGAVRTLLIASCGLYEDREGYTSGTYWQVLRYDGEGRLANLFDFYSAYAYRWGVRSGAPFLEEVARVSTAGAADTTFVAR